MAIIQTPSIASVVEDQSPQLGGNLDCQDYQITDVGLLQWGDATLPYQASVLFGNTLYFTPSVATTAKYLFRGASANKNLQHSILSTEIITYIGSDQSLHTYRGQNASLRYRWRAGAGSNVNAELGTDYLELRDGANPFTQTIFNTYTDVTNNEALSIGWDTNEAQIKTTAAGTGTQRVLNIGTPNINMLFVDGSSIQVDEDFYCTGATNNLLNLGTQSRRWGNTYSRTVLADAVRNTSIQTHTATGSVNIYETMNLVDATSGAVTLTLPAASGTGLQMTFKKIDASANTVTIDGNGTETIDGALTKVISTQYNSLTVVSDGSNWFII